MSEINNCTINHLSNHNMENISYIETTKIINVKCFIIFIFFIFFIGIFYQDSTYRDVHQYNYILTSYKVESSPHWLILTSTTQLEQYLISPQLNMSIIVIGNYTHSIPSSKTTNIIFLDSQLQSKLAFRSTNIKHIAYILAIKHGARFIYQFNSPISLSHHHHHRHQDIKHIAFRRQRSPFINIHPTFAANFTFSSPGLPKDELLNITQDGWSSIRTVDSYQETIHPLIQQQILIFYHNKSTFVQHPPVAVEPFTFAPFSSENILFTYDAFWGLVLSQSKSDIWRSWWVQRLLWDIDGHLTFSSFEHQIDLTITLNNESRPREEDENVGKLVRFLSEWKSGNTTLVERIEELINDMIKHDFCDANELKVIREWLNDLQKIQYVFPSIKSITSQQGSSRNPSALRRRRIAVCLTGLTECIEQAWKPTAHAIRTMVQGEMDVFMYLSSTEPVVDQLSMVLLRTRLIETLRYSNFTVKVLFENLPKLDPHFPPNCTTDANVRQPEHKVSRYYQQLFGLSNCFSLVRDYEKKHNIKYDIMIRLRGDFEFTEMPLTFDRESPLDINTTLILIPNRSLSSVNDGFAIGPMDAMEVYMNRYYSFRECLTDDLRPEHYIRFYLNYRKVKTSVDGNTSMAEIPHHTRNCH